VCVYPLWGVLWWEEGRLWRAEGFDAFGICPLEGFCWCACLLLGRTKPHEPGFFGAKTSLAEGRTAPGQPPCVVVCVCVTPLTTYVIRLLLRPTRQGRDSLCVLLLRPCV
jgi:hypothetical protein